MLDITFRDTTNTKRYTTSFFENFLDCATRTIGIQQWQLGLSLNLIGKEKIRELNKQYRSKDKPTDVLSFPLLHLDNPLATQTPPDGILELGDIFISPDIAQEKAIIAHTSLEQELAFLVVHGFLHLLGYDHERSKPDEEAMFSLQEHILTHCSLR